MNIWTSSSRLVISSRHVGRLLIAECSHTTAATGLRTFSICNRLSYSTDSVPEIKILPSRQPKQEDPLLSTPTKLASEHAPRKAKGKSKEDKGVSHNTSKDAQLENSNEKLQPNSKEKSMLERRRMRRLRRRAAAKERAKEALATTKDSPKKKEKGSKKEKGKETPTFDSQLGPERWKSETWSNPTLQPSEEYRSPPPHTPPPSSQVREASLETTGQEDVLIDVVPKSELHPVARLSHNLERTLFNPGVHWLRDPRSHVYNFTPWLERIPKVNDFAFERLTGFIRSSQDRDLYDLAKEQNKKFTGSTSSLSGMLSHIYFLLSEYKEADTTILSQHFKNEPSGFTAGQRMPATVKLNYNNGVYAVDSHSAEWDDPDKNILTWLGTLLENFLTKTPEEFKQYMRVESAPIKQETTKRDAYRFAQSDKFVMRSQLDCQDERLPGTGVFDIKTRACVSIRMDILNFKENAGYLIRSQFGVFESFEREYYDLIRSAFLKYIFQVRIGNMDGVMVAYHNTERIFGFQYISRDEMDERLFGPTPGIGDKVFNHSVKLLEAILDEATQFFPEQSILCGFETRMPGKVLDVFIQPAEWQGEEEERPIVKLAVTLDHELNGKPVRASSAMRAMPDDCWKITYNISRVALSDLEIRSDYKEFMQRKKRSLVLPSGVSLEDAEKFWNSLNFGNTTPEEAKMFRPESFALANSAIEKYRELARVGRAISQKMDEDLAGRPKIVLGMGVYEGEELYPETEERESDSAPDEDKTNSSSV